MLANHKKAPLPTSETRVTTASEPFVGLGTRLSRILSNTSSVLSMGTTVSPIEADRDRSRSRGRPEAFHSSGRGGVGNIRAASVSRDSRPGGPDDFSLTRGREVEVTPKLTHSGRGGAGNIRSPSREPTSPDPKDIEALRHAAERDAELPHSSGRGGAGNIYDSRSRSRSRADAFRSSGRGGAGNMVPESVDENVIDEERKAHHVEAGIHSTGRGGAANITTTLSPNVEHPHHQLQANTSSGRGGAGNIHEASRTSKETSRTRDASMDLN